MWTTHVDLSVLQDYKNKRLLKCQHHPSLPLSIWNYADVVQCTPHLWDPVTKFCRGLIVDNETGEIVARSFSKFWNDSERKHDATPDYDVFEKMDGSLGIIFNYRRQWMVASRGSFVSDQAQHASQLLFSTDSSIRKYNVEEHVHPSICLIVEIIYPENRIVVDYGERNELVLLAAFRQGRDDWEEVYPLIRDEQDNPFLRCGFPIARSFDKTLPLQHFQALDEANQEGFVIRFSNGQRMKIKFKNYKELHRVVTNLSTSTLFDSYRQRTKTLLEILEASPDEFHTWIRETWQDFQNQFDNTYNTIQAQLLQLLQGKTHEDVSQKEFAQLVSKNEYRAELFMIRRLVLLSTSPEIIKDSLFQLIVKRIQVKDGSRKSKSNIVDEVITSTTPVLDHYYDGPTLTFTIGISGSGKSTWAAKTIREKTAAGKPSIIVSRDKLRQQLFGYDEDTAQQYYADHSKDLTTCEDLVTDCQYSQIDAALLKGVSVIMDDTNLNVQCIKRMIQKFSHVPISYQLIDTTLDIALARNQARRRVVPESIILKQFERLKLLRKRLAYIQEMLNETLPKQTGEGFPACDPSLPSAVVCDLDGTLCLHTGRSPFEWHRVEEDAVNVPVQTSIMALAAQGHKIIICTGRSYEALAGSERWLQTHGIPVEKLYIRKPADVRADYIAKEEMWRDIVGQYNVLCMFDDRVQVVNHARRLGFVVFQVAEGKF